MSHFILGYIILFMNLLNTYDLLISKKTLIFLKI